MSTPDLNALINLLSAKLQLEPWDASGNYVNRSVLTLMDGISSVAAVSPAGQFRPQDVEPLLQQANALLDRALADRYAFQQAGEKFATFTLDMRRTIDTVAITGAEQADGRFETPYDVSLADYEGKFSLLKNLQLQLTENTNQKQKFETFDAPSQNLYAALLQKLENLPPPGQASTTIAPVMSPDGHYGAGGGPDTRENQAYNLARGISQYETSMRSDDLSNRSTTLQSQIDALTPTVGGSRVQVQWDDKNRKHLADRAALEMTLLKLKLQMATIDYLLDFRQQMNSIAPRFRQTVVDAYDRLLAVEAGMNLVYGRVDPRGLPALLSTQSDVDEMIAWARRTGTWLAALTRRSHNYVLPVSVKIAAEATAAGSWKAGNAARQWTFALPASTFDQQYFIRVRGIAGWVVSANASALWTINAQLPTSGATWLYEGGSSKTAAQDAIKCRISGVTTRANRMLPDVVGLTAAYNATPIGQWMVTVSDAFDPSSSAVPDDIQLDLYLAVLPA